MSNRFLALLIIVWYPLCIAGLWLACRFGIAHHGNMYMALYLFVMIMFAPLTYQAFFANRAKPKKTEVKLDVDRLPSFQSLSTTHWPADQQAQFTKAVDGIRGIAWLQEAMPATDSTTRERIATAMAFAAFSELRRRMRLAPDEELIQDEPGRVSPSH